MNIKKEHLIAPEGKILRRISDGQLFGSEIYLGYTHYLNNEPLPEPLLELPEHYEEIDEPLADEDVVIDKDYPLVSKEPEVLEPVPEEPLPAEPVKPVTISDYRELERKVETLMKLIGGSV